MGCFFKGLRTCKSGCMTCTLTRSENLVAYLYVQANGKINRFLPRHSDLHALTQRRELTKPEMWSQFHTGITNKVQSCKSIGFSHSTNSVPAALCDTGLRYHAAQQEASHQLACAAPGCVSQPPLLPGSGTQFRAPQPLQNMTWFLFIVFGQNNITCNAVSTQRLADHEIRQGAPNQRQVQR